MLDTQYTVTGINLDQYIGRLNRLEPALNAIGVYTERLAKEAIIKGQTMGGSPLAPLAASTVAEKQLRKKARGILRRDGALLASIAFARTKATEVQVGTNLEYAPWVILGTKPYTIRPVNAPALRFYVGGGAVTRDTRGRFQRSGDTGWRSARVVNHPGLPSRNIFEGFQQRVGPFAEAVLRAYLETGKP